MRKEQQVAFFVLELKASRFGQVAWFRVYTFFSIDGHSKQLCMRTKCFFAKENSIKDTS